MKYGLALPNGGAWGEARTLAGLARLAEESGWDGIFLEDYIVWQGLPGGASISRRKREIWKPRARPSRAVR